MTVVPGLPRLPKGALIGINSRTTVESTVVFQYNPDKMTRRLEARAVSQEGDRGEAYRLTGEPKESITLSVEIDATDQLADAHPVTVNLGLHPALAALELMMYPRSRVVMANDLLTVAGTIEIVPAEAPMLLFVWGAARVVPVRLSSFSVTEEAFDARLNPIRATVELSLEVLGYTDLAQSSLARALYLGHHIAKEVLANTNPPTSDAKVSVPFPF